MSLYRASILWLMAAAITLDQITKTIANTRLAFAEEVIIIPKLLSFQLVYNSGAAYGILAGKTFFLVGLSSIIVIAAFIWSSYFIQSKYSLYGLAFILAGAIGNLIDRIRLTYVIDFINIHILPNFNIADMLINVGVLLFIIEAFKDGKRNPDQ